MSEHALRIRAIRDAYDRVAVNYAAQFRSVLNEAPLDRAMLVAFAEITKANGPGAVAELGCGPGHVAAYLAELGLDIVGVDLSPAMIDVARATYPDLRFQIGSMDALDLCDGELYGIVSWYSIIHTPPRDVPAYFAEFSRVLAVGGYLLLAFFESQRDPVAEFDHKVTTAYRWPINDLLALACDAGFSEVGRMLREPSAGERFRQGRLLLRNGASSE